MANLQSAALLLAFTGLARAQPTPQFASYPATGAYQGKNAPLVLTKKDRMFRTRLREAAVEKPNFAGHYILTEWGCGAGCVMGAVIDANSGHVYWLPHTICCWSFDVDDKFEPIDYRMDSRLIIFSGERNEKEGDDGVHFYEFNDGKFVHLKSSLKKSH
jgi:hypothetical protein